MNDDELVAYFKQQELNDKQVVFLMKYYKSFFENELFAYKNEFEFVCIHGTWIKIICKNDLIHVAEKLPEYPPNWIGITETDRKLTLFIGITNQAFREA